MTKNPSFLKDRAAKTTPSSNEYSIRKVSASSTKATKRELAETASLTMVQGKKSSLATSARSLAEPGITSIPSANSFFPTSEKNIQSQRRFLKTEILASTILQVF